MINEFLLSILVDPVTKNKLDLDIANSKLIATASGKSYQVIEDVPVLVAEQPEQSSTQSPLHDRENSQFNYADHYNKDAAYFDYFAEEPPVTKEERRRSRECIIDAIGKDGGRILDIGCGGAWLAAHFTKKKKQVVSMDIAVKNPVEALKHYPGPYHAAVVADALRLPYRDGSFDVVVASEIMEHVYEPVSFVAEWLRVVKPGGKLIIVTPYNERIVFHMCVHCNHPTPANAHLHSFNETNIQAVFPASGVSFTTKKFNNKWFTKLRVYYLLRFLPFSAWRVFDKFINKIAKKPDTFLITAEVKK